MCGCVTKHMSLKNMMTYVYWCIHVVLIVIVVSES